MRFTLYYFCLILLLCLSACTPSNRQELTGNWQVDIEQAVAKYAHPAEARLKPAFEQAGVPYPPQRISLLSFKEEGKVELWAANQSAWSYVKTYPLTAKSGTAGPKLQENDYQIPEGFYEIIEFNPHSDYHLSLLLNYPNDFDKRNAKHDGRHNLGSNIFIHGSALSAGCLAVGDKGIEELFVLVYRVGKENSQVVIAPKDMRLKQVAVPYREKLPWLPKLYHNLHNVLKQFKNRTS